MRRRFKLWRNTWKARIEALLLWHGQLMCPHTFRPARVEGGPGRVCRICDKVESLTPEEFFAQFGERNWQR